MTNNLTLVPAGAGSGKTHRIEQELAGLVETGQVGASRILAVTFAESAAAELRGRIRGELMRRGRIEDALAIDRAYVGTIHALGQRLLTEHAFAAGRNPDARLVTESERDLLIRREVGRSAALLPIISDLERFGYQIMPSKRHAEQELDASHGLIARADARPALNQMLLEILHIIRRRRLWRAPEPGRETLASAQVAGL
jgi:ATP-dependent helicase/nuclease subunit A